VFSHVLSRGGRPGGGDRMLAAIRRIWGVHLTGVSDLPPRAARRRSLQAGRMSALPRRLWAAFGLWFTTRS
jgi:hypothetical protein